jgi:hypothetical protein
LTVGTPCDNPSRSTHIIDIKHRARYIEIVHQDEAKHYVEAQPSLFNTYTSRIGNCIHALSKYVQLLVGNIPALDMPMGWDTIDLKDIIVTTDRSVLFGFGYHSWVIVTTEEEILITGGGPDDGNPLLMTTYRSELGGQSAGLAVLGTMARSGPINICSVKCVCDNKSAILASNRQTSENIFHKTETDYDVISTIHELQDMWCNNLEIKYSWVKGHEDQLEREPEKYERLHIMAHEICDEVWVAAMGSGNGYHRGKRVPRHVVI